MIENDKGIVDNIDRLTSSFNEARQGMPLIPSYKIARYRDRRGHCLFPNITDESLWNESMEVIKDVSEMKLDVRKKRPDHEKELRFETTRISKRKFDSMSKMRMRPINV